jgi:hypothetical protein
VEVAGGDVDLCAPVGYPFHLVTPFAGHLDSGLHRVSAGVHRQHRLLADQRGELGAERPELVVQEGPAGEGDPIELGACRGEQSLVVVTGAHRRVGGEEVQVTPPGDVGDPGPSAVAVTIGSGA